MAQLDPALRKMLNQMASSEEAPLWELTPQEVRPLIKDAIKSVGGEPAQVAEVMDMVIPGPGGDLPLRIYKPRAIPEQDYLPVLVFYHGGGWVWGDLDTIDVPCRYLSKEADCIVVSVDYRLAPEHPFPAGIEDAMAALQWVAANGNSLGADTKRIAIGGGSAGGNLAAVVSQMARDEGRPKLAFQLLIYPALDMSGDYPSRTKYASGYFLEVKNLEWFFRNYLSNEEDALDPRASPILSENLRDLPPALVITAGFDPLKDEGEIYAERMKAAGVPVEYTCYGDMIHGFVSMSGVTEGGKRGLEHCSKALRSALHGSQ